MNVTKLPDGTFQIINTQGLQAPDGTVISNSSVEIVLSLEDLNRQKAYFDDQSKLTDMKIQAITALSNI